MNQSGGELVLDDSLFDDAARLAQADTRGLLRQAALAGAQVRSVTESASEAGLHDLTGSRPRAVVLVARPGVAQAACELLVAVLGSACPVPVVVAARAPSWVGALDVVFAHTDDFGDPELAESVALATRRGAGVVLSAPEDGPVVAAAAGRAKLLMPKLPVPRELLFSHVFSAGLNVLAALGLLTTDIERLADELDSEAERAHPNRDLMTNPAKTLAIRLADHLPLLWGVDAVGTALASHGGFALGCHAGMACSVDSYPRALAQHGLHKAAASAGSEENLFADPEDTPGERVRPFLVSARYDEASARAERSAVTALPGADLVAPGESVDEDVVLRSSLLAVRFDLAAVYLGIATGALDGPGWQTLAVG